MFWLEGKISFQEESEDVYKLTFPNEIWPWKIKDGTWKFSSEEKPSRIFFF